MSDEMNTQSTPRQGDARPEGDRGPRPDRGDRGDRGDRPRGRGKGRGFFRKKVCRWCVNKEEPDYKQIDKIRRYVTERGKILPRRITGSCAKHQRSLSREIMRARTLAYLPYVKK